MERYEPATAFIYIYICDKSPKDRKIVNSAIFPQRKQAIPMITALRLPECIINIIYRKLLKAVDLFS